METILDSLTCLPLKADSETEDSLRARIVYEARSWTGTPYHPGGQIKGCGVDCATLIYCTMVNAGIFEREEIGVFSPDWFCHVSEDVYMRRVVRHAFKVVEGTCRYTFTTRAGCICMLKTAGSRVYNHGFIVTDWPNVVHAVPPRVEETDASRHPMIAYQHIAVFDPIPVYLERMNARQS